MTTPSRIRVLLADDHEIARAGTAVLLGTQDDLEIVGMAENGAEAVTLWRSLAPDVLVVDLRMPVLDGVSVTATVCAERRDARVLVLSHYDGDADVFRALHAGARGYLRKDSRGPVLIAAIRAVARGERYFPTEVAARLAEHVALPPLTAREQQVLGLVANGMTNRSIADALGVGERTVVQHVSNLLAKLRASSRTEAVAIAERRGLLRRG